MINKIMKVEINRVNKIIIGTIGFITIATSISGCGLIECGRIFCPDTPSRRPESTFKNVSDVPRGIFNYGGSTTFAPLRSKKIVDAINNAHPRFILRYEQGVNQKPGSGTGIKMLLEGQLDFSQSSRSVKDKEFEKAQRKGFTLKQEDIAIDGIAFYVNPQLINLGMKGITLEQAQKIFIGEIKNWEELGGPNLQIVPFSRNLEAGGTVEFFYKTVLEKKRFGQNVREIRNTTNGINSVARNIGGIGYATASEVINQRTINVLSLAKDDRSPNVSPCATDACQSVNQNNFTDGSYPLTRKLFVVIKQDNGVDQKAGEAYKNLLLTDEGQKLIKDAGFVPIRLIE